MGASMAKTSWNRYNAAFHSWTNYANFYGKLYSWPFDICLLRGYVNWAINVKHLQPNTVRIYLSDLKLAHCLRNAKTDIFDDFFIKKMLKGADHLKMYSAIKNKTKLVMTFQMLRVLGHEISKTDWTIEKKRLFWSTSCLAYFGSFRMGELLAKERGGGWEDLKWSDVTFRKDGSILINIRFPKVVKNTQGDFADIFPITGKDYCPVRNLKALAKFANHKKNQDKNVFSFEDSRCLTTAEFTCELRKLLRNVFGDAVANLSGHSFRAGIPAALCNNPEIASEEDVMCWGRWSSEAYKLYTKLKLTARKIIFDKILCAIM
jgi:hypothetical protein